MRDGNALHSDLTMWLLLSILLDTHSHIVTTFAIDLRHYWKRLRPQSRLTPSLQIILAKEKIKMTSVIRERRELGWLKDLMGQDLRTFLGGWFYLSLRFEQRGRSPEVPAYLGVPLPKHNH